MGCARGPGRRPVPDGARPGGDERRHLAAGRRLRHHGDDDPVRHRPLRPGDGGADADRRQARGPLGPAPGIHDRHRHLRLRVGPHGRLVERPHADARVVDPRGDRRRAGPPRAGRPGRGQLQRQGPRDRLRGARRRRGRRDRGRPDPGRLDDHRLQLALRVRRRGRGGRGHPDRLPPDPRARARGARPVARLGRQRPLGQRPGPRRHRGAPGQQLGMAVPPQLARGAVRLLADAVRDRGRRRRPRRLPLLAAAPRGAGARPAGPLPPVRHPVAARRARDAPRPEPDPDGDLLHHPALPAGGERPGRPRDRRADAPRIGWAVRCGDRRIRPGVPLLATAPGPGGPRRSSSPPR